MAQIPEIEIKVNTKKLDELTQKLKKLKPPWYENLGGKRLTALLVGLVGVTYVAVIGALLLRIEMAFDLAKYICGFTLVGLMSYITGRTVQNVKNGKKENGGENG